MSPVPRAAGSGWNSECYAIAVRQALRMNNDVSIPRTNHVQVTLVPMRIYAPMEGVDPSESAEEVWAPAGYDYLASNRGRIFDLRQKATVRQSINKRTGYASVYLQDVGRRYVHQLVLHSFRAAPERCLIKHLNGRRADNRLCNLAASTTRGRLTKKEKAAVVEALRAGELQIDVARKFGLSRSHVNYYAKKIA